MAPLRGHVALVTGASRGVGRATAQHLAQLGATVVVTARTVEPREDVPGTIHQTAAAITAAGGDCHVVRADLLDRDDLRSLVDESCGRFGFVDILVNNAAHIGEAIFDDFWSMTSQDWHAMIDLNLNVPWELMKAFAPAMRERGSGLIVNVTSSRGNTDRPPGPPAGDGGMGAAYPTSKAALTQMTAYVGNELRRDGIAVVAIDPGFARSESNEVLGPKHGFDPAKAQPVEVAAKAIGWLATSGAALSHAGELLVARTLVDRYNL